MVCKITVYVKINWKVEFTYNIYVELFYLVALSSIIHGFLTDKPGKELQ